MERAIGIRVSPTEVYYTILQMDEQGTVDYVNESLIIPKALDIPRKLSYIRTSLFSLICEYGITKAGLRIVEGISQNKDPFRVNIEGVIQELLANSTVSYYFTGRLDTIGSKLGKHKSLIKECRDAKNNEFNIPGWEKFHANHRESFLVGYATIYKEDGAGDE
ncbi:hypothetical protein SAMN04487767_1017 [Bacillus wiedmannii]|uniref:Uncharacterized protein n=1 Tax=Bacillus wiedmannii TaxID=1890302 RepID=A0A1G6I6W1_9BACI|nr:hypothetical protein [Bacillus wiedmannii]SDC02282.1 hypothetical protein SAMN04487767_1017 [Bacillus wiedmannii]